MMEGWEEVAVFQADFCGLLFEMKKLFFTLSKNKMCKVSSDVMGQCCQNQNHLGWSLLYFFRKIYFMKNIIVNIMYLKQ